MKCFAGKRKKAERMEKRSQRRWLQSHPLMRYDYGRIKFRRLSTMKKAVEYLRYSSDNQTEQSIEGQCAFATNMSSVTISLSWTRISTAPYREQTTIEKIFKECSKIVRKMRGITLSFTS